jgi:hypothetical protein
MPSLAKTASKSRVNLLSRSRIRKRKREGCSWSVQAKLARLLGHPGAGWVGGAASEVDAAAGKFDEEEDIEALQRDCLHCEEVDREHALRLRPQEGAPRDSGALAGRADAGLTQDLLHGRCRHAKPESVDLAGDPLVAQRGFSRASRRTSWRISPPIGGRPARLAYVQRRATSRRCQRSSVFGVTTNDGQRDGGSNRLAAARKSRSVGVTCGRLVCGRSTAS